MITIKNLNVVSLFLLLCLFAACNGRQSVKKDPSQLPDSTLISIRDGFDIRVADLYNAQKGNGWSVKMNTLRYYWKLTRKRIKNPLKSFVQRYSAIH